jgi:carbamoyl-phosphate synthase large subunit
MFLGATVEQAHKASFIDPWFLAQIEIINNMAHVLLAPGEISEKVLRDAKRLGFSDFQIAQLTGSTEEDVRKRRSILGMHPVYKTVDTCAAEFKAMTPYHYSSYDYETDFRTEDTDGFEDLGDPGGYEDFGGSDFEGDGW